MLNRFRVLWAKGLQVWSVLRLSRFDVSTAGGRSKERYRRIAVTAISAVGAKGIGIVTVLISVPLTVEYLGAERFGLWMTISSISALLSFSDFGMGGGLLNAIAQADGAGNRVTAQKAFSSTFLFLMLGAVCDSGLFRYRLSVAAVAQPFQRDWRAGSAGGRSCSGNFRHLSCPEFARSPRHKEYKWDFRKAPKAICARRLEAWRALPAYWWSFISRGGFPG